MSILEELTELLSEFAPVETGVFSDAAPEEYMVFTPIADTFELFADNMPDYENQEVRISIYSKYSSKLLRNKVTNALVYGDFIIGERRYVGREDDSGYFHYVIDVAKLYPLEE